jgi:hypothetical protein
LALWKSEYLGSDPKLDSKLFTSRIRIRNYFFGSGSKTRGKMGSGSEKNSYGSITLLYSTLSFIKTWICTGTGTSFICLWDTGTVTLTVVTGICVIGPAKNVHENLVFFNRISGQNLNVAISALKIPLFGRSSSAHFSSSKCVFCIFPTVLLKKKKMKKRKLPACKSQNLCVRHHYKYKFFKKK